MKIVHNIQFTAMIILFFAGFSCKKSATKQAEKDETAIKNYMTLHNISATRTASGLYYTITKATNDIHAQSGNTASVRYTGRLTDGTVFDENMSKQTAFSFVIGAGQVIAGWDEGIALMRKGEKATLLLPSALGYGSSTVGSIPANSVLIFDVELVDLK